MRKETALQREGSGMTWKRIGETMVSCEVWGSFYLRQVICEQL